MTLGHIITAVVVYFVVYGVALVFNELSIQRLNESVRKFNEEVRKL